ncbi:DUF1963 domain-containing protein [Aeoliella sp.]|uniref:DUF1963 domain-containing protein n=1 Tax=Aeoliella sp. TaxID=2795800 RepID=UPI003CCBAEB2
MSNPFDANPDFKIKPEFLAQLEAMKQEAEKRVQQRREARLAAGLCETAGTGRPEPEIAFLEIPRDEEEEEDEYLEEDDAEMEAESPFDDPTIEQRADNLLRMPPSGTPEELAKRAPEMLEAIEQLKSDLFQDQGFQRTLAYCREVIEEDKLRRQDLIELGDSRLGGLPDLPKSIPWPESEGKLLPFVAQLDLSGIPATQLLPNKGWMYVFAWIGMTGREVAVHFYDGDKSTLERAPRPSEGRVLMDWLGTDIYAPVALRCLGDEKPTEDEYVLCWLQGELSEVFGTPGAYADHGL